MDGVPDRPSRPDCDCYRRAISLSEPVAGAAKERQPLSESARPRPEVMERAPCWHARARAVRNCNPLPVHGVLSGRGASLLDGYMEGESGHGPHLPADDCAARAASRPGCYLVMRMGKR